VSSGQLAVQNLVLLANAEISEGVGGGSMWGTKRDMAGQK